MSEENGVIVMYDEDDQEVVFQIIETTKLCGKEYILAVEEALDVDDFEEAECYIFRNDSAPDAEENVYVFIEDEDELRAVSDIFQNLLDDVDIEN